MSGTGRAVAIQMDPVELLDIKGDSTFVLGLEAQRRGYRLFDYPVSGLSWSPEGVTAPLRPLSLRDEPGNHYSAGTPARMDLSGMDVVLMRQDPPFDMSYVGATHMLEHIHPRTLVVNDPVSVRNAPEKLYAAWFREFMPPTLITADARELRRFREEQGDIVLKPLYGNGGVGVIRVRRDDENLNALLDMYAELYPREPVQAQAYLPEVRNGDKRILLVDGEPIGVINRVPQKGEVRANMHVGGRAEKAELNERDVEICEALGPRLKREGLIFVGIDVIGPYLTEINTTSPTGLRELQRFDGTDGAALVWDAIEARLT
ncbi:MAG: glutathione synthase [Alphaproteobacteria bacterium]